MKAIVSILLLAVPLLAHSSPFPESMIGGCGGCANMTSDQPGMSPTMLGDQPTTPPTHARIGPTNEPGEPLHIKGKILDASGKPRAGVVVYAFHANREGVLEQADKRLTLRGWALSDAQGDYSFDTIRPGNVMKDDPAHIHFSVREVGRCAYYIDDIVFADDPRLNEAQRQKAKEARGGSGIVAPSRDRTGVWQATRDITLGLNVPGYEQCTQRAER